MVILPAIEDYFASKTSVQPKALVSFTQVGGLYVVPFFENSTDSQQYFEVEDQWL